jgi:NADPH:quinone reductase-like Zn-dependent oxidoreductase
MMTTYILDPSELALLKGKTILIFGAATGIGHAAATIAHRESFPKGDLVPYSFPTETHIAD